MTTYTFTDTARDNFEFYVDADVLPEAVLIIEKYMPAHFATSTIKGSDTLLPEWLAKARQLFA